jgi:fructose-1,6-bisphosphatase III
VAKLHTYSAQELRLLQLLSKTYPTIGSAHTEIINLSAILALPKGTDHYISDIHGAYDQFDHMLRHASGAVQRKINQTFGVGMTHHDKIELATLIYYPRIKLRQVLPKLADPADWMVTTISNLVLVARSSGQKYTRSKVRKRLTPHMAYILEELLSESQADSEQRTRYYDSIIHSIVALGEGENFIIELAFLIQRLVVDRLYVLGDIYDRGPAADRVMDRLMDYHAVSIQWGNHDIAWMGAAAGCDALIATVIRVALRYANLETLAGYGISLRALTQFANATYGEDACMLFQPRAGGQYEDIPLDQVARMHKAITLMQLKLEAQIIERHPEYQMQDRLVLNAINIEEGCANLYDQCFPLLDRHFPTLHPEHRAALSESEAIVVEDLRYQFQRSMRLQEHIRFLYSYGNMFEVQDGNLKFHGCVPVDAAGDFTDFPLDGTKLAGPALLRRFEQMAREAYFSKDDASRQAGQDAMWYLWCGQHSPLYGRTRMTTFERYFIADKATHEEPKGPYYALRGSAAFARKLLASFGGDPEYGRIINGHVPVKVKKGESPLMAGGQLIVIDGGMSEAYQSETGIAGYTLISSSHEMWLAAHEPFDSPEAVIERGSDVTPHAERVAAFPARIMIADTDLGRSLQGQIEDLRKLVIAYREGILPERGSEAVKR